MKRSVGTIIIFFTGSILALGSVVYFTLDQASLIQRKTAPLPATDEYSKTIEAISEKTIHRGTYRFQKSEGTYKLIIPEGHYAVDNNIPEIAPNGNMPIEIYAEPKPTQLRAVPELKKITIMGPYATPLKDGEDLFGLGSSYEYQKTTVHDGVTTTEYRVEVPGTTICKVYELQTQTGIFAIYEQTLDGCRADSDTLTWVIENLKSIQ